MERYAGKDLSRDSHGSITTYYRAQSKRSHDSNLEIQRPMKCKIHLPKYDVEIGKKNIEGIEFKE